jgi:hypothetical protein
MTRPFRAAAKLVPRAFPEGAKTTGNLRQGEVIPGRLRPADQAPAADDLVRPNATPR